MKNAKQRLEELQNLLEEGYVTENEYRVARVNILKENGIDLTIHTRSLEERRGKQAEEPSGGCGCGCFLTVLFLAAAILAVVWIIIPQWPDRWGGAYVREAKEWAVELWSGFFQESPEPRSPSMPDKPWEPEKLPKPQEPARQPSGPAPKEADTVGPLASPDAEPGTRLQFDTVPKAAPDETSATADEAVLAAAVPPEEGASADSPPLPGFSPQIVPLPDAGSLDMDAPLAGDLNVIVVEIPASSFDFSTESSAPEPGLPKGSISARRARIRSVPDTSTNANVVGWGQVGDRFSVLEEGTGRDGAKWYRIRYETGNKQGWISGSLVTLE